MSFKTNMLFGAAVLSAIFAMGCSDPCADAADALEPCCGEVSANAKPSCDAAVKTLRDASSNGSCNDSGGDPKAAADTMCTQLKSIK